MDDPLLELTPGPTLPVASAVVATRAAFSAAIADLLAIPDAALESVWEWRTGFTDNTDVRYAFYRIHERLEDSAAAIVGGRAGGGEGPGRRSRGSALWAVDRCPLGAPGRDGPIE